MCCPIMHFSIGADSTIEDFSVINNGVGDVSIGSRTRIGIGNTIIGPVQIDDDVIFAQHVTLSGLNHEYRDVHTPIHKQPIIHGENSCKKWRLACRQLCDYRWCNDWQE